MYGVLWGSYTSDGDQAFLVDGIVAPSRYGSWIGPMTSTAVTLKAGNGRWLGASPYDVSGSSIPNPGYVKVILSTWTCSPPNCYDSGWVSVSGTNAVSTFTHNLADLPMTTTPARYL